MTKEELNESALNHLLAVLGSKDEAIEILSLGVIEQIDNEEIEISRDWVIAQLNIIRFLNAIEDEGQ